MGNLSHVVGGGDAQHFATGFLHIPCSAIYPVCTPAPRLSLGARENDVYAACSCQTAQGTKPLISLVRREMVVAEDQSAAIGKTPQGLFERGVIAPIGQQPEGGKGLVSLHQSFIARA